MTVSTEFHNWSDHPHGGAARAKRGSPALMRIRDHHLRRWGGQSVSSASLYDFRLLESGKPSPHAGCAVDLRWFKPGPGREVVEREMLPFYIDNSVELHIQAIHDYVGCRVWRAHRSGDANRGWKTQKKGSHGGNMGNPESQWLHLEINRSGWDDDRPVEEMLGVASVQIDGTKSVVASDKRIVDAPPSDPFDLSRNVKDPHRVRWLQTILNERGWGKIAVTGTFDAATETAVKVMQRDLPVDDDGSYGRLTAQALSAFLQQNSNR